MIRKELHQTSVIDVLGQAQIPETTVMEPFSAIYIGPEGRLTLGERNIFYPHSAIRIDQGSMTTGIEVSFGPGCQIYEPRGGLTIGDHCMIGGGTIMCGVNHGWESLDRPMRHQPPTVAPIVLEDDVWIGMGVLVLPGVRIGRGSIIAAGAIVTRDIPPGSVAAGQPARVTRRRAEAGS